MKSSCGRNKYCYGERDILLGRGGSVNKHSGNKVFRRFIAHKKNLYKSLSKDVKPLLIDSVLQALKNQGARFLKKDEESGMWREVSRSDAFTKTSQALREGSRKARPPNPAEENGNGIQSNWPSSQREDEPTHGGVVTPLDTSGNDSSLYDPIALNSVEHPEYYRPAFFPQTYHEEGQGAYARNQAIQPDGMALPGRIDFAGYVQDFPNSPSSTFSHQYPHNVQRNCSNQISLAEMNSCLHPPDAHRQFSNNFIADMIKEFGEDEISSLVLSRVESTSSEAAVETTPGGGLVRQTTDISQLMREFETV